jgi:NhaA family Na+:H+ antiporter
LSSRPDRSPWLLRFIGVEAMSAVLLLAAALLALGWANSPWAGQYRGLWHVQAGLGLGAWLPAHDLHFWVNDGLMCIFFLVVGLEIRREIHDGALAQLRVATLPLIAALGGVLVPALLYLAIGADPAVRRGWAIPTATDIAFAVGALSLAGRGLPPALRMLLLTLAIVDDIVAIAVIACFYSAGIAPPGLALAAVGVAGVLALQSLGIRHALVYVLPGAVVWFGMLKAGLHPTLAGVLLGLMTPATGRFGLLGRRAAPAPRLASPLALLEARLHPWVAFGVMPLFALANAGVSLQGLTFGAGAPLAVGAAIVTGLVFGKPAGIVLATFAGVRLKLAALPAGVRWPHIVLLGLLGGIGFTMSIFIAGLAFAEPTVLAAAKFAVLLASTLAAALALLLGRRISPGLAP